MLNNDLENLSRTDRTKKILIVILAVVLLCCPTALAFGYVFYYDYLQKDNYFTVTIYSADGKELAFEEEQPESADEASLTSIFYSMTQSPNKLTTVPSNSNTAYIKAVTNYKNVQNDIKCYFSATDGSGYYIDAQGNAFSIAKDINAAFLNTAYAECYYENAKIYQLKTIDHDIILPKNLSWSYKNAVGEFALATQNANTNEMLTYEITGAIDVSFDTEPDFSRVYVYDKNELIYDGDLEKLSELTATSGHTLDVKINAEWYKKDNSEKYGKAFYEFSVLIKNRSEFSVSSETVSCDGFLTLECTNVSDLSKIVFTSDDLDYSPIFSKYKNTAKALIYFPHSDTEQSYDFTITYGAATQSFSVKALPSDSSKSFSYNENLFAIETAPTLLDQARVKEITELLLPQNDNVYFQGNFLSPTDNNFSLAYSHNGTVSWGEELEYSYTAIGNGYISNVQGGAQVKALENGIVSYIGNSKNLGRFVVVDHGCGLRTWYTHLSSVDVEPEDIILKGQALGKAGPSSIFGEKEGFTLYCTVYDTVIDPTTLWEENN